MPPPLAAQKSERRSSAIRKEAGLRIDPELALCASLRPIRCGSGPSGRMRLCWESIHTDSQQYPAQFGKAAYTG
jgi:hypothetical protein